MTVRNTTRFHVGISGSYGGFNLGDEAILHVLVSQLRESLPVDITVFSRDAQDTRRRHQVERVVDASSLSRRETQNIVAGRDLFILGGGGILYDSDADMYLREVLLAHETNTPVMVCAISAGPLVDPALRCRVRDALNKAAVITVRDRHARQLLEEVGVERDIVLTADPAMLLEPEPLTLEEIFGPRRSTQAPLSLASRFANPDRPLPGLNVEH
jgi:polysaccharide pyruvyl transferase WcaK-like protein